MKPMHWSALARSWSACAAKPAILIRSTLKTFGLVPDKGRGSVFEANVRDRAGDQPALWPLIETDRSRPDTKRHMFVDANDCAYGNMLPRVG